MTDNTVSKEYANQLKKYMKHYHLFEQDIANLANSNVEVIYGVINCEKGIVLKTLEAIANIFGLRYFELGNPEYPMPASNTLPKKTIEKIEWRKKQGPPIQTKYNIINLNQQITGVLSNYSLEAKFVPSDIFGALPSETKETIKKASRITDLFAEELIEYVEKTGEKKKVEGKRGRQEEYYRLIKKYPKDKK